MNLYPYSTSLFSYYRKKNYNLNYVYFFGNILPRLTITIVFSIEVILFEQIKYKNILLPFLIIPLVLNYLEYRIQDLYKAQCSKLNNILKIVDLDSTDNIPLHNYIELLVLNRLQVHSINFNYLTTISKQYINNQLNKYGTNKTFNIPKALNYYRPILDTLFTHYTIYYKYLQTKLKYKYIDIIIHILYFICWTYILVISFHTLDSLALSNLLSWLPPSSDNPFI